MAYTSNMKVIFNGKLTDEKDLPSRFTDGAYLYGMGAFETLLFRDGRLPLLKHHETRLKDSLKAMGIPLYISATDIQYGAAALAENMALNAGVINIYASAGERQLADGKIAFSKPYWSMVLRPAKIEPNNEPVLCCVALSSGHSGFAHHHKAMSYLHHIVSLRQFERHPLLADEHGAIMETPLYGVGFVAGDTITFPHHAHILPSTSRAFITQNAAQLKVHIKEETIHLSDLTQFDSLFLHNAVKGIVLSSLYEKDNKKQGQNDPVLIESNHRISQLRDRYWDLLS